MSFIERKEGILAFNMKIVPNRSLKRTNTKIYLLNYEVCSCYQIYSSSYCV